MKKIILGLVAAGLAMIAASDASAGIFSWLFRRSYAPSRPVVTAPANTGVRAYSYEPGTEPEPVYTERGFSERGGRKLNAWEYPKTDARRYSGGDR